MPVIMVLVATAVMQAALAIPATLVAPVQLAAAVAEEAAGRIVVLTANPALREITLTMAMVVMVKFALGPTETPAMVAGLVLPVALAMQALALLTVAVAMLAVLALVVILVLLAMPVLARLLVARHQIHGLVRAGRLVMLVKR